MRNRLVGTLVTVLLGVLLGLGALALVLRSAQAPGEAASTIASDADEGQAHGDQQEPDDSDAGGQEPDDSDAAAAPGHSPAGDQGRSSAADPEPEPRLPPPPEALVSGLQALLAQDEVQEVERLSVLVIDEEGRTLAAHQPDLAVTPASTTKLVTAAAALHLLGPDYRYVTRIYAEGPVSDGVLDGDLVVVGSGDPALASPVYMERLYPARPHTPLDGLAEAVEAAGITAVRGAIRADPQLFADEPVADGWVDRYFWSLNTANVSGLTVDAGRRLFERDDVLLAEAADDPALRAAEVLEELLAERDIKVSGGAEHGGPPPGAEEVGRVISPPMRTLLAHVVKSSDNHMADGIYRTLGAVAGAGTWDDSDAVTRDALAGLGLEWGEAELADGSGLSRHTRLSARMLVGLDLAMTDEHHEEWTPLLAVAGESGTLRTRWRGTPADGTLIGKTGSLRDVRALVAQVTAPDARRYHFAVLGSDLDGPEIQAVRSLMDEIALLLASGPPACLPDEPDQQEHCR